MKVQELMSREPVTVYEDATVLWACQQMEARRQSAVLVVPRPEGPAEQALGHRQPTGILSEHDLVKAMVRFPEGFSQKKVREVMSSPIVSIGPEEEVQSAANLMILLRVRRLPVVQKGRLVGLVSRGKLMEALRGELDQVKRQAEVLEEKVGHDPLTRLPNRLLFDEELGREFDRAKTHAMPLALLLIDLDRFKLVNDTYGHPVGDIVLKQLAQVLRGCFRKSDLTARWGGEEFTVLLPHTDPANAQALAEKFRSRVEATPFGEEGQNLSVTISAGLAYFNAAMEDEGALLKAADKALYAAKEAGRNKVVVAGD